MLKIIYIYKKSSLRIFLGIGLVLKRVHFEASQFAFPLGHFQVCVFLYNSVCKSATCFIIPPLTNIVQQPRRRVWLYVIQFPAYCWCSMNFNIRCLKQNSSYCKEKKAFNKSQPFSLLVNI